MNLLNNLSLLVFLIRTKFLKSNFLHSYSISNHFKFITSAVILKNGSNLTCVNPADDQLFSCSYIVKTDFNYQYYITLVLKTNRDKYLMTSHFTLLMREAGICDENYCEILCTSCALLFFSPPFLSLSVFSQTLHTNSFKVFSSSLFYVFFSPISLVHENLSGLVKNFFL